MRVCPQNAEWRRIAALFVAATLNLAIARAAAAQISLYATGEPYAMKVTSYKDIPFRSVVRQQYDFSCGSAALATLLRFQYGRSATESEIFRSMYVTGDQAKIRQVGFSLLDIKHYLERQGLAADGYRESIADLQHLDAPAIALVKVGAYRHFVVIKGVRDGRVLVGDPALGLQNYKSADFEKVWTGILFALHPNAALKAQFNRADEWKPWAKAPIGSATTPDDIKFTRDLPPLYQVVQLTPLTPSRP